MMPVWPGSHGELVIPNPDFRTEEAIAAGPTEQGKLKSAWCSRLEEFLDFMLVRALSVRLMSGLGLNVRSDYFFAA